MITASHLSVIVFLSNRGANAQHSDTEDTRGTENMREGSFILQGCNHAHVLDYVSSISLK